MINTYQETLSAVGGAVGGLAAGSASGQTGVGVASAAFQGGDTAHTIDVNNRQLHTSEEEWLSANATEFAKKEGITEKEALRRLSQQALKEVDLLWRAQLSDGDDDAAKAYLAKNPAQFTNEMGDQQDMFTVTGRQLTRPELYADTANRDFYRRNAQTGISRGLKEGILKELGDSGVDVATSVLEMGKAIRDNPAAVLEATYNAVKDLPGDLWDKGMELPEGAWKNLKESGLSIGEGAAVVLNQELTDKLNALYGTDVEAAQKMLLAIRLATAVTDAVDLGKTGKKIGGATATAIGKKLDEIKLAKAAKEGAESLEVAAKVQAEVDALRRIGQKPSGPDLTQKSPNSVLDKAKAKENVAETAVIGIPERVQARINLRNGSQAEGAGWGHVVKEHFSGKASKSQFTVDQNELRLILQSKEVVQTPVSRILESADGPRYVREIDLNRQIGIDKFNNYQPTSTLTILTDRYGNLVTTTPGKIK